MMIAGRWRARSLALMRALFLALAIAAVPLSAQSDKPAAPAVPAVPAPEEKPAGPPELTEYMGRTIAKTMHWMGAEWLLRADREQEENAALMMENLKVQPGWTVCDLGSGNGYHALKMSQTVGEKGTILAVDIQAEMLDMLKARAETRGIKNIRTVLGEPWDPKLEAASCDLILLVDVYHEFGHPEQMLKGIHKALKPSGVVALVEFRTEDERVPIKPEHKMSRAQIYKEWQANGFAIEREYHGLPWQHLVFLRQAKDGEKPVDPPAADLPPNAPGAKKTQP
jgi:ubiquinone/menaquinone biosynthesis C-methylase UbiE